MGVAALLLAERGVIILESVRGQEGRLSGFLGEGMARAPGEILFGSRRHSSLRG